MLMPAPSPRLSAVKSPAGPGGLPRDIRAADRRQAGRDDADRRAGVVGGEQGVRVARRLQLGVLAAAEVAASQISATRPAQSKARAYSMATISMVAEVPWAMMTAGRDGQTLHADVLAHEWAPAPVYRTGMVVPRSTATAVTLFCGDPSMTRSE